MNFRITQTLQALAFQLQSIFLYVDAIHNPAIICTLVTMKCKLNYDYIMLIDNYTQGRNSSDESLDKDAEIQTRIASPKYIPETRDIQVIQLAE